MTTETAKKNKPTHTVYLVRDYTDKTTGEAKSDWTEIGVAWLHKDGKGFDIKLFAVPLDGKIVMRLIEPKKAKTEEA